MHFTERILGHYKQLRFFQNVISLFLDTLSQQIYFLIIKINNFWGDLSGISAKPATLTIQGSIQPSEDRAHNYKYRRVSETFAR